MQDVPVPLNPPVTFFIKGKKKLNTDIYLNIIYPVGTLIEKTVII